MMKGWSIKTTLQFWAISTVAVVLVMAFMANYANSLLSETQHIVANKQLPTERNLTQLSNAVDGIASRQKKVLASSSLSSLQQQPERTALEQDFHQNWQQLAAAMGDQTSEAELITNIYNDYQDILSLDQALYDLKSQSLHLAERLRLHYADIDLQIDHLRKQITALVKQLRAENLTSVQNMVQQLQAMLEALEALNSKSFLTDNGAEIDILTAEAKPIKQNIDSELSQVKSRLWGQPALLSLVRALQKDFDVTLSLMLDEEGLYPLHQQRVFNQALLQQELSSANTIISLLKNKLAQLSQMVKQQNYVSLKENVQLAERTRWLIVVLTGLISLGMMYFAAFMLRRVNTPITALRQSIQSLAEGNFFTRITKDKSQNEDVALEFNQFAGNMKHVADELALARQALEANEQHIRTILNGVPEAILTLDLDGNIQELNPAAEQVLAASQSELTGQNLTRFLLDDTGIRDFADIVARANDGAELEGKRFDGSAISILLSLRKVSTADGEAWVCLISDVTTSKETEQRLQSTSVELKAILDNAMVGIAFLRERQFVRVNEKFAQLFGYSREEIEGKSTRCMYLNQDAYDQFGQEAYQHLASGDSYEAQLELLKANGEKFWCSIAGKAVDADSPRSATIWLFEDITTQRKNEEHLMRMASIDDLTGLPNRAVFNDRVEHAIHKSERDSGRLAVFFLDLDHFKQINDSLGHKAGDILLMEVANRIKSCLREGDTVARLGGDEFTILLEEVRSAEYVGKVAEKVLATMTQSYQLENTEVSISPSIGISLFPADGRDVDILLRNADAAMYHAKKVGRNNFQFYSVEMNAEAAKRLAMETALRRAVEKQELQLHFQPQIDLNSGKLSGAEVLLRWNSEQWGMVSPAEFVPMLEDTGLIVQVGEWVLKHACETFLEWRAFLPEDFMMAVNLSGRQFKGGMLPGFIRNLLQQLDMPASNLELEITESILMEDTVLAKSTLAELSELDISLAIDDFGTGYSSLSYLKQFPLNVLKIDSSFIRDVTYDQDDAAIVNAIMAMANSLGMKVVAEGVETPEQLQYLQAQQCQSAQGYLFSKAIDKASFIKLIDKERWI
jgi:diguanylate cyclase (GGDEF)-like protein/PAS domain S-box-containing protein